MPEIIGHDHILRVLEGGLPRVSIFRGPYSVGKRTTAMHVAEQMDLSAADYLYVRHLDADRARSVRRFIMNTPQGERRLAVVSLANASEVAQNILLAALESIPETSHIILIDDGDAALETVLSRGNVFLFQLLSAASVKKILMGRNFGEASAEQLAYISQGHVSDALRYASANDTKIAVLGAVRCLRDRDAKGLSSFAGRWSEDHTVLLTKLCHETLTGRSVLFEKEHAEALGKRTAMKILSVTRQDVRPRLVIHAQLMGVLRGE